ncbi:3-mercaptopyruvate sulfurtransferase [Aurantimonas sp. C2-6-R+9]|uniref:3-mercaptopyruvate sulfurtransferase n=1 Tax=unclassified Aurantimonas TaxID=2638230 RepID=UPI002E16E65B|nr:MULTISPECIES: 3-mercaptopyruvate sulfurtransferase [unclassified Aurantimonas]MEC5290473.1 3-mercaptopyruvate sulfurtransferase [Aurantimonas sp. C2-3-R2]MEC5380519.1 3-mercaptopyruvate sulfurtransferase [Aurantimonas sp. C2-6-R+9]MEC5411641.1 3-mercaptopyruvate sulfurtransferase [Aurantimonas sp. C2-4-R8]
MSQNPFLIAPADLAEHLGRPGLSIVDASWYLPAQNRLGRPEFDAAHIPGAVFFDQDEIVDPASDLPHTLPSPDVFAAAVGDLGVSETDTIVVYDGVGLFTAPRVWWLLRTFGAKDVRVLDGGFPAWQEAGLPVETGAASPEAVSFAASFDRSAVASLDEVKAAVMNGRLQIADARPAARFTGEAPEPRAGVRAGHMPSAFNVPFMALSENGRLKSEAALRAIFAEAGLDPEAPVVTSCGSGVTAAVLNLALESLGNRQCALYDGSWTEWGSAADTPVETGR